MRRYHLHSWKKIILLVPRMRYTSRLWVFLFEIPFFQLIIFREENEKNVGNMDKTVLTMPEWISKKCEGGKRAANYMQNSHAVTIYEWGKGEVAVEHILHLAFLRSLNFFSPVNIFPVLFTFLYLWRMQSRFITSSQWNILNFHSFSAILPYATHNPTFYEEREGEVGADPHINLCIWIRYLGHRFTTLNAKNSCIFYCYCLVATVRFELR